MVLICNNGYINLSGVESIEINEKNELILYTATREYTLLVDCEKDIETYYKLDPSKFSLELASMLFDYINSYDDGKISITELLTDVVDNLQHKEYEDHICSQPVEITWTEVDDK